VTSPRPYRRICVSAYEDDLEVMDAMVKTLKARGITDANRSALIRYALSLVDVDKIEGNPNGNTIVVLPAKGIAASSA
jgi:hypothetical protein